MLEHGTCKLYTLSANQNEYKKLYRTISGDNKMTELDEELVNDSLTAEAIQSLSNEATENYPKIHTAAPDIEIIFSITSSEGLYSSKNRSTLYFDSRALMPCRI